LGGLLQLLIGMGDNLQVGELIAWLWNWISFLSYWVALIIGTCSLIIFFATKNRKYMQRAIVLVVVFAIIKAVSIAI
jgi:hypothetical protein